MKKHFFVAIIALICLATAGFAAGSNGEKPIVIAPTQAGVTGLAQKYLTTIEPNLEFQDQQFLDEFRTAVFMNKGLKSAFDAAIGDMVSHLTLKLAACKSAPAVTAASAYLVTVAPKSPRTNNLFGAILHSTGKFKESIPVLEYTLSLAPKSTLAMVNLANAYLDADKDVRAKSVLDKALALGSSDRSIYRALATYYWKKKDMYNFKNCLVKAAKFGGITKKKVKPRLEKIEKDKVESTDGLDAMKTKTEALEDAVPLSSADIIEEDCPDVAQKIRDKYGKLIDGERMILPKFPQVKLNSNKDYIENSPIIGAWISVFADRFQKYTMQSMVPEGVDPNASDAVKEAQGRKAAEKQKTEALQNAEKMLKSMKGMNLGSKGEKELRKAMTELKKAAGKTKVKLQGDSGDDENSDPGPIPGFDSGSLFAEVNYKSYVTVSNSHEQYIFKLLKDLRDKEADILKIYKQKIADEDKEHNELWNQLQEEHKPIMHPGDQVATSPHGDADIPCRQEMLRHKKALNTIGDDCYRQWINLYAPLYVQKIKPAMDGYWRASTLYIKNMNNPDVMKREYRRALGLYATNIMQTATSAATGGFFMYAGSTYEEEAALQVAIQAAAAEGQQKLKDYKNEFETPISGWEQWAVDHFVVEAKVGVMSLKVTAKTIEFDAWLGGIAAGFKASPIDGKLETYTGIGGKFAIGLNVCGTGGTIEGKGDVFRKTAYFDIDKGTYADSYSAARGEVKGSLGPVTGSLKVDIDPSLNADISGKYSVTAAKYE